MGACILETSKLHMYKFWYDYLKNKCNDKVELIYTDTDSFMIEVETNDIYIIICMTIKIYNILVNIQKIIIILICQIKKF